MLNTHPHHQLQLAQQRQAEFLREARANSLARELRPHRPRLLDGLASAVMARLERRRARRVAVPRTSHA